MNRGTYEQYTMMLAKMKELQAPPQRRWTNCNVWKTLVRDDPIQELIAAPRSKSVQDKFDVRLKLKKPAKHRNKPRSKSVQEAQIGKVAEASQLAEAEKNDGEPAINKQRLSPMSRGDRAENKYNPIQRNNLKLAKRLHQLQLEFEKTRMRARLNQPHQVQAQAADAEDSQWERNLLVPLFAEENLNNGISNTSGTPLFDSSKDKIEIRNRTRRNRSAGVDLFAIAIRDHIMESIQRN